MLCDHDDTYKGLLTQSHSVVFHQLIIKLLQKKCYSGLCLYIGISAAPTLLTKLSLPVLAARNSKMKQHSIYTS